MTPTAEGRGESARDDRVSYWLASTAREGQAQQSVPDRADVVVIGAGIVGLTAAHLLCKAGRDVVVL
jgi:ribulose 1,5-bisphosphate synthetase/thiazole synthase